MPTDNDALFEKLDGSGMPVAPAAADAVNTFTRNRFREMAGLPLLPTDGLDRAVPTDTPVRVVDTEPEAAPRDWPVHGLSDTVQYVKRESFHFPIFAAETVELRPDEIAGIRTGRAVGKSTSPVTGERVVVPIQAPVLDRLLAVPAEPAVEVVAMGVCAGPNRNENNYGPSILSRCIPALRRMQLLRQYSEMLAYGGGSQRPDPADPKYAADRRMFMLPEEPNLIDLSKVTHTVGPTVGHTAGLDRIVFADELVLPPDEQLPSPQALLDEATAALIDSVGIPDVVVRGAYELEPTEFDSRVTFVTPTDGADCHHVVRADPE